MKAILAVIIVLAVALGLLPKPPHEPEGGTMLDAYNEFIANRAAYGRAPCLRTTGTPCPDPTVRVRCPLP